MKASNYKRSSTDVGGCAVSNGIVYTPVEVARALTLHALSHVSESAARVLEPSCGDGSFLRALADRLGPECTVLAIDQDDRAIENCLIEFPQIDSRRMDFFDFSEGKTPKGFDLIIGNPPYVRRHNFSLDTYSKIERVSVEQSYPLQHLKNTWAAFIVKAESLLTKDGVLGFVVPYELMTVGYGDVLRTWMEQRFQHIEIFVPDEKAFKAIDQDAVAIVAVKNCSSSEGTSINRVRNLESLDVLSSAKVHGADAQVRSVDMKSFLLEPEALELIHKLRREANTVSKFCSSAAGTVTAANDFFILTKERLEELDLSQWGRPIIKKSSYLEDGIEFDVNDFAKLQSDGHDCYLVDFAGVSKTDLPVVAQRYISGGEEMNLHGRYKSKHRTPWYHVPVVAPNDGFFFKRSHVLPRICANLAQVLTTDSAYHVRMAEGWSVRDLCYSFYSSLTLLFAEIDGRFYGGGVLELTPKEFRGLPVVYQNPSKDDYERFKTKFRIKDSGASAIAQIDTGLAHKFQLSPENMRTISRAKETLQAHRLRHGTRTS